MTGKGVGKRKVTPIGMHLVNVEPSPKTSKTLGESLADESSEHARIFREFGPKSLNDRLAKPLLKEVGGGFRSTSPAFKKRAIEFTFDKLVRGQSQLKYLRIYRDIVIHYLQSAKPGLYKLLNDYEIEGGDGPRSITKKTAEEVMQGICSQAEFFGVYRPDVELLVHLIPELQVAGLADLLGKVPQLDRVARLELKLSEMLSADAAGIDKILTVNNKIDNATRSMSRELSILDGSLTSRITALETAYKEQINQSQSVRVDLLKLTENFGSIQTSWEQVVSTVGSAEHEAKIGELRASIEEQQLALEDVIERVDKKLSSEFVSKSVEENETTKLQDQIDHLLNAFNLLEREKQVFEVEGSSDKSKSAFNSPRAYVSPIGGSYSNVRLPELELSDSISYEESFSQVFSELDAALLGLSEIDLRVIHALIIAFPVSFSSYGGLFEGWATGMGWAGRLVNRFVSPLWVEPNCWFDDQVMLSAPSSQCRAVVLNDFEDGLIETYLSPVLRSWEYAGFEPLATKLHLFGSNSSNLEKIKTPVINLDAVLSLEIDNRLTTPKNKGQQSEVTIAAIESWFHDMDRDNSLHARFAHRSKTFSKELVKTSAGYQECISRAEHALKLAGFDADDRFKVLQAAFATYSER